MPKDLKLPEGVEYTLAKIDDPVKGPALKSFREWAHKTGLSQAQVSEALAQLANYEIASTVAVRNAAKAERDAMGATAGTRVDAILQWVGATYPSAVKAVAATLATKAQVEMFESIMAKLNSGGVSYRGNGREPPEPSGGRLSPEQIAKLSPAEKLDYSRQFDQSKMPAWRDPRGG